MKTPYILIGGNKAKDTSYPIVRQEYKKGRTYAGGRHDGQGEESQGRQERDPRPPVGAEVACEEGHLRRWFSRRDKGLWLVK